MNKDEKLLRAFKDLKNALEYEKEELEDRFIYGGIAKVDFPCITDSRLRIS